MKMTWLGAAVAAAAMGFACAASAGSLTVTVAGTSNPFLAGYAVGDSVVINGVTDTAAAASPAYAGAVFGGETITFGPVTGAVSNGPCCAYSAANGNGGWVISSAGGATVGGFENFPINALVGVFYDPSAAQGAVNASITTLTPGVNQVFYIGDGSLGAFIVPAGATKLVLGTVDGYEWNNNLGSFAVTVNTVPEPATWAMLLAGFAGLGFAGHRRARTAAAAA